MAILSQLSIILFCVLISSFITAQQEIYTVQRGDSLESIAQNKLEDPRLWTQLAKYNRLLDPNLIKIGQKILIPTQDQLLLKAKEQDKLTGRLEVIGRYLSQFKGLNREVILEENFESYQLDTQPAGWFFPSDGKWHISVAGSRVLEQADRKALNSAAIVKLVDQSDYTIQVELQIQHSGDAGVFAYWNSYTENYRLRTSNRHNRIQIVKRVPRDNGTYTTVTLNEEPLHLDNGRWWIFRLEITTHQSHVYLKGKAWKKGAPEPSSWLLEASDHSSERYESGQTGVWTINAGSSYGGTKFDNFKLLNMEDD